MGAQAQPASGELRIAQLLYALTSAEDGCYQHRNEHFLFAYQEDAGQDESCRSAIQDQHRMLLRQTPFEELVVHVIRVRPEERLMPEKAAGYRQRDVEDWQSETKNRHHYAHDGRSPGPAVQRKRSQSKTDKQAPGIPHEDACGLEVEGHESEERSKKCAREHGRQIVVPHQ